MIKEYIDCFERIKAIEPVYIIKNHPVTDLVTIGVPTYNRVSTLKETLDSILSQDGADNSFNIMISDSSSIRNDETELYLKENFATYPGLTYCKYSEELNAAGNWNQLFKLCGTKYLVMVHDDDVLLPNFMRRMLELMGIYPDASYLKAGSRTLNAVDKRRIIEEKSRAIVYKHSLRSLFNYFSYAPTGCLINVKDLIETGGYNIDLAPSGDHVVVLKLLYNGKSVYSTDEILMLYRRGNNDTSRPETQLMLRQMDILIKEDLAQCLNLPEWYVELSKWVCAKMHEIIQSGEKTLGNRFFFAFNRICLIIHKLSLILFNKVS